jgi:hypothetical protein
MHAAAKAAAAKWRAAAAATTPETLPTKAATAPPKATERQMPLPRTEPPKGTPLPRVRPEEAKQAPGPKEGVDDSDAESLDSDASTELTASTTSSTSTNEQVKRIMAWSMARSTLRSRRSVTNQFRKFAEKTNQHISQTTAMKWLLKRKKELKPSSMLQYGSIVAMHLQEDDKPTAKLRMFLRGIRRTQDHTSHQALPMTRDALIQVIQDLPPEIHAPIFWAWATCSRMSDIRNLTKRNLVNYSPEYILVIFERTKTNWQAARRLDHLALVPKKHIPPSVIRYTAGLAKGDPLTTTTHRIAEALKRVKTSKTYVAEFRKQSIQSVRDNFTLHSMKRGAIGHLWNQARRSKLDPELIPLAAKHTGLWASKIPASTIAYAPVLGHVAEAVGLGIIGKALWL